MRGEFFGRDTRGFTAEQRGHDFFRRAIEKSFDEVAKSRAAGDVARHRRGVDVPEAVFFVAHVAFFFENAELGADGGITGLIGELGENLADGGALELIENVHDLAFAAREGVRFGFSGHVLFF